MAAREGALPPGPRRPDEGQYAAPDGWPGSEERERGSTTRALRWAMWPGERRGRGQRRATQSAGNEDERRVLKLLQEALQ